VNENLMNLLYKETGDKVHSGKLAVKLTLVSTQELLRKEIEEFPFSFGWLCHTDSVVSLYSADDRAAIKNSIILSGELANSSESLHIRQAENGCSVTRMTTGDGEDCLTCREEYVGVENKQQDRLQYEVYWKLANGSYRPWVARFAGIQKGGAN